jgi:hypothetical protein
VRLRREVREVTLGHGDIINVGGENDLVILGDNGSTLNQVDVGTGINTIDLFDSAAVNLKLQNGQFVDLSGHPPARTRLTSTTSSERSTRPPTTITCRAQPVTTPTWSLHFHLGRPGA